MGVLGTSSAVDGRRTAARSRVSASEVQSLIDERDTELLRIAVTTAAL
jgi:hypothetical protein